MLLCGGEQPRPRMLRRRSPSKGFGGPKKNLLGRVGSLIRFAEQELADEVDGRGVRPIELREPSPLLLVEATMQLVARMRKLNRS